MTLKETLEAIWKDSKCRYPCNIVWWHNKSYLGGHQFFSDDYFIATGVYYKKGRRVNLNIKRRRYRK